MDLTPAFNICLQAHGARPAQQHRYDLRGLDSFLQEAYNIQARIADLTSYLRAIRPAYLSATPVPRKHTTTHPDRAHPLSAREKDSIDASSKQLLRQLNAAITSLQQAESVRTQTAASVAAKRRSRGGLGALGRWAAGGNNATPATSSAEDHDAVEQRGLAQHREGVIYFLQRGLEESGRLQSGMMEIRLDREVEKGKSVLYKVSPAVKIPYVQDRDGEPGGPTKRQKRGTNSFNPALPNGTTSSDTSAQDLPPELLQQLEAENSALLTHYEDQLAAVRAAERSILDISELHGTLHANLQQQSAHIDQLVQDSYLTTENLGKGNTELKRASERKSTAQTVFYATLAFCGGLVVWDLVF